MNYNLPDHRKGDTFLGVEFEVIVNGVAIDVADYDIKMQFRKTAGRISDVVLELSTDNDRLERLEPTTDGKFKIVEWLVDIPAGVYVFDIQFTKLDDGGRIRTWIKGTWKILEEVTI
jgi:hypothetical protein